MYMIRNRTEAFLRGAPIQWCSVPWWENDEGKERVQKRMNRIRGQLRALNMTQRDEDILALATLPTHKRNARMKRLTATVQKRIARKSKPNGQVSAEWVWLYNPGEYESWYELYGAKAKVFYSDQTEAHLIRSRTLRNLLIAKLHSKWMRDRSDTRSWKSTRRIKWRVLGYPGYPSAVLS